MNSKTFKYLSFSAALCMFFSLIEYAIPKDIKNFLESIGYDVEWVKMQKGYPAGYSSSGKTKYYNAGYNEYYTLKISY